jgi:23S rRNA (guanosine2251-2'-O)-methyltransferase
MSRLVYGVGPVRELLRSQPRSVTVLYVAETRRGRDADPAGQAAADARGRGIAVEIRPAAELDAIAGPGVNHQGLIALAGEYEYGDVDAALASARDAGEAPLLVALDSVQDPHNLGAVIRSAYVLGAHGVIIPRDRAARVTATVTKVSAGATEHIAVAQVTNLARTLEELREHGLWRVAVAAGPEARPLWEIDLAEPICLILGAEGTGIRPLVARHCDFAAHIPMPRPGVGSLNVSVAAGAALYEVTRQRAAR